MAHKSNLGGLICSEDVLKVGVSMGFVSLYTPRELLLVGILSLQLHVSLISQVTTSKALLMRK